MRNSTRSVTRSIVVAILTALAALVIGVMSSLTTAVTASIGLTAFQAIIVPGTGTPDPYAANELPQQRGQLLRASRTALVALSQGPRRLPTPFTGVNYYATFWPIPLPGWGGLEGQKWNVSVADGVDNLDERVHPDSPRATPS